MIWNCWEFCKFTEILRNIVANSLKYYQAIGKVCCVYKRVGASLNKIQ